jgi:hypothetical protein
MTPVSGFIQPPQLCLPLLSLFDAQLVQVSPGVDARGMTVIEYQPDSVVSYRLDISYAYLLFTELQHLLTRSVALHLR